MKAQLGILSDLVLGELQQMSSGKAGKLTQMEDYLLKTFNKTASLMSKSCRSEIYH